MLVRVPFYSAHEDNIFRSGDDGLAEPGCGFSPAHRISTFYTEDNTKMPRPHLPRLSVVLRAGYLHLSVQSR